MAYNICVNCGTNLNHFLKIFVYEREAFEKMLINEFPNDTKEQIKEKNNYFTNMFILRHNIDRICCRSVFITFNDYVPSTM
jgi:hypothetical protein